MLPSCFMLLKRNSGGKDFMYLLLLFYEYASWGTWNQSSDAGQTLCWQYTKLKCIECIDLRSSPGFCTQKKSSVLAVMRLGLWFICRERHVNRQERQTDSDSTRGDSSLQKDNNSWRRGTCNERECFRTSCSMAFHYSKVLYFTHSSSLQHDTFVLENMSLW